MRVAFRCPKCQQKYSLPKRDGLKKKRVDCRKCDYSFRVIEGLARKPSQPKTAKPSTPETSSQRALSEAARHSDSDMIEPVVAQLVDTSETVVAPLLEASMGPVDMSIYFVDSSASNFVPAEPAAKITPPTRHLKNPIMIPAVLGAIAFSFFLAFAAFTYRIYRFASLPNTSTVRAEADTELHDSNAHRKRPPIESPPVFPPPSVVAPHDFMQDFESQVEREQARMEQQELLAQREFEHVQEMIDHKNRAMTEFEVQEAQRTMEREKRRFERAEERRILADQKRHLEILEETADKNPLQGLIYRIPIDGWGAKSLTITNDQIVFYGTTKGVIAYDCKRNKIMANTEDKRSLDYAEALELSHSGKLIAAGDSDGVIELFKTDRRGRLNSQGTLAHHEEKIMHLIFGRDDTRLISIDKKSTICFWNLTTMTLIRSDSSFSSGVESARLNVEGSHALVTDGEAWISLNVEDGEPYEAGQYPFSTTTPMTYSPDLSRLLAANGSRINIMDVTQTEPLHKIVGKGTQWTVTCVDSNSFLTGGRKKVYSWDTIEGTLTHVWSIPDAGYIQKIAVSPDGSKMAATSGSASQDIYVFELP